MGNTQTWPLTTSSSAGRSTPAHLAPQGDKCRGDRDGLAYRGTARAVRRVLGVPRQLGLRFDRWAISGPSSGPNEALDRLWWPQSAISGHIRTSYLAWFRRSGGGAGTPGRPFPATPVGTVRWRTTRDGRQRSSPARSPACGTPEGAATPNPYPAATIRGPSSERTALQLTDSSQ